MRSEPTLVRRPLVPLVLLALVLSPVSPLGASGLGRGGEAPFAAAPAPRANVRVNDPSKDDRGRTNREAAVVASGGNVVVAFEDASADVSGYAVSKDGGATFVHRRLKPPPDGSLTGSPALAAGLGADVYYATLMTVGGGYLSTVGVARSTDGGETFGEPVDAVNAWTESFEVMDDPAVAVDASASKYRGRVYVTWTYTSPYGERAILFARSTDGGETYSAPGGLTGLERAGAEGSSIVVGPAGEIHVAWLDRHSSPPRILVRTSTDGGSRFGDARRVASVDPLDVLTGGGGGVRANSHPRLAVDGSGRLHVAWAARPEGKPADRADVFHSRSVDGGASFSAPRRVNDDAASATQAFPAIAVTKGGRVAIRWADRRNGGADDLTDVCLSVSPDGGATWGRSVRVTDTSFTYGPVEPGVPAGEHGDDDGLAASGEDFLVAWTDERGSDPDVYFARVPAGLDALPPALALTPSPSWTALRAGDGTEVGVRTSAESATSATLALTHSGAGSGLSGSFQPSTVAAGQQALFSLRAAPDVPARTDLLTLRAEGGGLAGGAVLRATTYPSARPFELPANLTGTPGKSAGAALADPSGRLHLVFEDDSADVSAPAVFYARGLEDSTRVGRVERLTPEGGTGSSPVLAAGADGRVVVAWTGRGPTDTTDRLWVARSRDGGETFAPPVAVTPSSQLAAWPAVALDAAGNVLVGWYDFDPEVAVLYTARSTDGGATFSAPAAVDDDSVGAVTRPGLAFDAKGAAYLVYTRQYYIPGTVASAARIAIAPDGRTFARPVSLTDEARAASYAPDVAVGADGAVLVAYYTRVVTEEGTYDRDVVVSRSTDGGATFSPPVDVAKNAGQSWFPAIAAEPGGGVLVAWEDDTGSGIPEILVARSTDGGVTYSAPVDVSGTPGLSGSAANSLAGPGGPGRAAVSVSADGRALVSWLDDSPANPDVFAVRLDPRALTNRPPSVVIDAPSPGASVEAGVVVRFAGSGSDPDGDPLAFSWSFGDGWSDEGTPAAHVYANPGTRVVTLTATDRWGAAATASVTLTVARPTLAGETLLLPVVLDARGVGGSRFGSELTLASRRETPTEVLLAYTASLGSGSGFARVTLAPGEQRFVPNLLEWLRQQRLPLPDDGSSRAGTLRLTFGGGSGDVFAGVRTFTADPRGGSGTFGVFTTGVVPVDGPVTVYGLRQDAAQRSNLALVNGGDAPLTLRVSLFGPLGEPLGALPDVTLGGWGWTQLAQPLAGKAESGRAVVTRVGGSGPFSAYGVRNDAVTSDGSCLPPLSTDDGSGASRLLPVVLDVAGLGARFRTELTLANLSSAPLPLRLTYVAAPGFGSGSGSLDLTLAAGEQRDVPDAIAFLRGALPIEADGRAVAGSLRIDAPAGTPAASLAAGARTYTPLSPAGSFGVFSAGLTPAESSDGVAWVHALREDGAQRSNLALVHRGDAPGPITLRVTLFDGTGAPLGDPVDVTLGQGEWRQLGRPLDGRAVEGYAKVERVSGSARFVAYGVLNDNVSSDGSWVPMSR